jgi:hypothetical protein
VNTTRVYITPLSTAARATAGHARPDARPSRRRCSPGLLCPSEDAPPQPLRSPFHQPAAVSAPAINGFPLSMARGRGPHGGLRLARLGRQHSPHRWRSTLALDLLKLPGSFVWPRTGGTLLCRAYERQSARSLPLMWGRHTRVADEGNASGAPVRADSTSEDRSASIAAYDAWRGR